MPPMVYIGKPLSSSGVILGAGTLQDDIQKLQVMAELHDTQDKPREKLGLKKITSL